MGLAVRAQDTRSRDLGSLPVAGGTNHAALNILEQDVRHDSHIYSGQPSPLFIQNWLNGTSIDLEFQVLVNKELDHCKASNRPYNTGT